jgi:4-amino-4-deoxy-L-arabinose transferase-like glycosyltransferase
VPGWLLLLTLTGLALLPWLLPLKKKVPVYQENNADVGAGHSPAPTSDFNYGVVPQARPGVPKIAVPTFSWPLLVVLAAAIFLRTANLWYSEFQGDEALTMITAAEALTGHDDALFIRAKGPAEVLLPLTLWPLIGVINETAARLPFTLASLWSVIALYLLGRRLGGSDRAGWLAAAFFAFNGFMVAFGRIVQYQALVVWFSAMAFLFTVHWRQTGHLRLAGLAGLCLGAGLLAHYDAVLVLPALGWLLLGPVNRPLSPVQRLKAAGLLLAAALLVALPFYLPFALNPQAGHTGSYVGGRIGQELRNNLPDFFHFNTFYSSAYYLLATGLLVLAGLARLTRQGNRRYRWLWAWLAAGALAVVFQPDLLAFKAINLAALPFALLFLAAFWAVWRQSNWAALVVWLAAPFLGYNFVVALGLTHIYTIVPAWSLLAAWAWTALVDPRLRAKRLSGAILAGLAALSTLFLWHAFVRSDVSYKQDYPQNNLALFWTPYKRLPQTGFFGFPHRAGWKAIGRKIAAGDFVGDYGSNEEPDVTTWYTRHAPRACDSHPEFYFLAADLVDPVEAPQALIFADYRQVGAVNPPNGRPMQIWQLSPATLAPLTLADLPLAREFDRSATPAAFARAQPGGSMQPINFGSLIHLVDYTLDDRRAYPGGRVAVTLYWQAAVQPPTSFRVFAHLDQGRGPAAQADGVPVCWTFPTDRWRPGQIIADQHALALPPDMEPGLYPLLVGLYQPDTQVRLDVLDVAGNPAGVSAMLTQVEIGDKR